MGKKVLMKVNVQVVTKEDRVVEIDPDKIVDEIASSSTEVGKLRPSTATLLLKAKVLQELGVSFSTTSKLWDISLNKSETKLQEEVEHHGSHSWFSDETIKTLSPEETEFYKAYLEFDQAYCKFRLAQDNDKT